MISQIDLYLQCKKYNFRKTDLYKHILNNHIQRKIIYCDNEFNTEIYNYIEDIKSEKNIIINNNNEYADFYNNYIFNNNKNNIKIDKFTEINKIIKSKENKVNNIIYDDTIIENNRINNIESIDETIIYICHHCAVYKTNNSKDVKRHLCKKNKCNNNTKYNYEESLLLSISNRFCIKINYKKMINEDFIYIINNCINITTIIDNNFYLTLYNDKINKKYLINQENNEQELNKDKLNQQISNKEELNIYIQILMKLKINFMKHIIIQKKISLYVINIIQNIQLNII